MKELCDKLGACDQEVVVLVADLTKSKTTVFGTEKAVEYIDSQPHVEVNLLSFCEGILPANKDNQCGKLREEVQRMFNQKINEATNGKCRRVSYKMVEDGKIKATGLPMNVTLKKPSAYGKQYLIW
ncbi:uncharacterized protein LOC135683891 [Rhopilema esculentum]|uniref:uncharacterized protein LOC135683891 n=1 Tax=Rhopilema esculentum TaxID=499914 RepID=UPI0031DE9F1A